MMQGLYSGASGVKAHSEGVSVIGNNLANANTLAYKQQSALFQDMFSANLSSANSETTGVSQLGMGVYMGTTRTLFTEGAFEPGTSNMDLAIGGKGYFKVTQDHTEHYTRAGNFRFGADGVLRDPNGFSLMGIAQKGGQDSGPLSPISLDLEGGIVKSPPIATTAQSFSMNLGFRTDKSSDAVDPYFSMLKAWNGTATPPLAEDAQSYTQPLTVYDTAGTRHNLTMSFDNAPSIDGLRTVEFLVQMPPADDASARAGTAGAGLLMSGTMTFNADGSIKNINAFTPTGADGKDLANWKPAPLVNGMPAFTAEFAGLAPQTVSLNLGIAAAEGSTWGTPPASAAQVGLNGAALGGLDSPQRTKETVTAKLGSSITTNVQQDGFPEGSLANLYFNEEGMLTAEYNNNTSVELFRVPLFRFTSEDGLHREGMNHFSATDDSGKIQSGRPGSENFGKIQGKSLETSNVDTSREMVNLIVYQRGLQTNSKSVMTADAMIQKALELKK